MNIDLCPVCRLPAHATESDDLGRHRECQPPALRLWTVTVLEGTTVHKWTRTGADAAEVRRVLEETLARSGWAVEVSEIVEDLG